MDREHADAAVAAIVNEAKATRKRPSRTMWIAALVVAIVCVAGLVYGLVVSGDAQPTVTTKDVPGSSNGNGFGLGLVIGIGAGVVIGSLIAVRKR